MQHRSNLPRPFNKGKKIGDRKVISSTTVNGKTVHQQVVYQINSQSLTRHEKVQVFYIFPTQHCQDQPLPNTKLVLALIFFINFIKVCRVCRCSYKYAYGRLWAPHFVRAVGTPTAICTFARVPDKDVCPIAYARTPREGRAFAF